MILVSNVTLKIVSLIFMNQHICMITLIANYSPIAIPVDTNGICYVARIVDDVSCIDRIEECNDDSESEDDNFDNNRMYTNKRKPTLKWHCTDRCKPIDGSRILQPPGLINYS